MMVDKILNIQDEKGNIYNFNNNMNSSDIYLHGIRLIYIFPHISRDVLKVLKY